MNRLLALVLIKDGLHLVHDLLVPAVGTGTDQRCLGVYLYLSAGILGQSTDHSALIVGQQLHCLGAEQNLAAILFNGIGEDIADGPAAFAGAAGGVGTEAVDLIGIVFQEIVLNVGLAGTVHAPLKALFHVAGINEPVGKIHVGIQQSARQLVIALALGHPLELLEHLLPLVGKTCRLMPLGIMHPHHMAKIGAAAGFEVLLHDHNLFPGMGSLGRRSQAGCAAADHEDVAAELRFLV